MFGCCVINDENAKTCFYTGLPDYRTFLSLFTLLQTVMNHHKTRRSLIDDFYIVLVLALPIEVHAY
jgi:hypothetical protein